MLQDIFNMSANEVGTLAQWVHVYGSWVYALMFLMIFGETGFVVLPFLPGDTLLFAAGTLAGLGALDPWKTFVIVVMAAFLGDNTNFAIGRRIGATMLAGKRQPSRLRPEYVDRTQRFLAKHGGKTIAFARFFPFLRTYAPFMAGVGKMHWPRFAAFSAMGSVAWSALCVGAGFLFGGLPIVRDHFELILLAAAAIGISPAVIYPLLKRVIRKRRERHGDGGDDVGGED